MARTIVYQGRRIQVATELHVAADGRSVQRDVVLHPGAVAILPLVDDDRVCLLRNHRFTIDADLWEIPAGTLEPGEAVEKAAVRELAEETGYQAGQWQKLTEFYPSPGVLTERMYLFLARDLTPGKLCLDVGEQIEPRVLAWRQVVRWALDGTIQDAKTLVAILLWDRLRRPGC